MNLVAAGRVWMMAFPLTFALLYVAYLSPVLIHGDSLADRGLGDWRTGFIRADNLRLAARICGPAVLAAATLVVVVSLLRNPRTLADLNWKAFGLKLSLYLPSAVLQDLWFVWMVLRWRAAIATAAPKVGRRQQQGIAAAMGVTFAVFHLPNPALSAIALVAGMFFTWSFCRAPNLLVLVCSHALLGTLLHRVAGLYTRIGTFYWNPDQYVFRSLFPPFKRLIGDLF